MACGLCGFRPVLAGGRAGGLALLELNMVTHGQVQQSNPVCQQDDNAIQTQKGAKNAKNVSPERWKLSKQQQDFIDLFAADDHKKQ
jgi:hypothetical protein